MCMPCAWCAAVAGSMYVETPKMQQSAGVDRPSGPTSNTPLMLHDDGRMLHVGHVRPVIADDCESLWRQKLSLGICSRVCS